MASIIVLMLMTGAVRVVAVDIQKPKIAVMDFQLEGWDGDSSELNIIVADWLATSLANKGRFEIIERRLLQEVLAEQSLEMSGVVEDHHYARAGKILGVESIIAGSVIKIGSVIEVSARIIDTRLAGILAGEKVKAGAIPELEEKVSSLGERICGHFPLSGEIALRANNGVFLDIGELQGVQAGMQFDVFKEGNKIFHPKTGEILGVEKIESGRVEVTEVEDKFARARIITEKNDGEIKQGCLVKSIAVAARQENN